MHKENCTVSFVMSEPVLNMNNVIYNSGSYKCLSHQAVQLCSPLFGGLKERYRNSHVTLKVDPNKQHELANNVVISASAGAVSLFLLSLALVAMSYC